MKFRKIILKCLLLILLFSPINNISASSARLDFNKTSLKSETWVSGLSDLPITKSGHGTAVVNGKIYSIGGEHIVNSHTNSVEVYDPKTDMRETKAPMPTPRGSFATEVVGDNIYCIGGISGSNYVNVVEVYNTKTDIWTTKTAMPTTRGFLSSGVVDGIIYCIGGKNNNNLNTVEAYNTKLDTWETKASLPTTRYQLSSEVVDGKIYAIGGVAGFNDFNVVEIYDPIANSWSAGAKMPTARGSFASVAINENIYCLGGMGSFTILDSFEVYNTKTNTWITKSTMPTKLYASSAVAFNETIYLIGGVDEMFNFVSSVMKYVTNEIIIEDPVNVTSNIDVYIRPQSILSVSLNTNVVSFEDFDGIDSLEIPGAINIFVESNLPYDLFASLESEISNSDNTKTLNEQILGLKENSSKIYKNFTKVKEPIILMENVNTPKATHKIDMILNKDIPFEIDAYKASIKFEVVQK